MNQSPTLPQPPAELPKPKSKLWPWIVLIIVVLIVAGYFGWTWYSGKSKIKTTTTTTTTTPTITPEEGIIATTSNPEWKMYTNPRVNYQFEFPAKNLSLDLHESIKYPSTDAGNAKDDDLVQFATNNSSYGVRTTVGVNEKTIEDWLQTPERVGGLSGYTKTTVGNKTAYTDKEWLSTYVMSGNNVYQIDAHVGSAPKTETDPIYEHFFSTFQFTK